MADTHQILSVQPLTVVGQVMIDCGVLIPNCCCSKSSTLRTAKSISMAYAAVTPADATMRACAASSRWAKWRDDSPNGPRRRGGEVLGQQRQGLELIGAADRLNVGA